MAGTNVGQLINGMWRGTSVVPYAAINDQSVSVVASGATPPTSITGPVSSGTAITLPNSASYTLNGSSIANLQVYLNGDRLEQTFDWTTSGSGPNYTAIQLTFGLVVGDRVDFRIERSS